MSDESSRQSDGSGLQEEVEAFVDGAAGLLDNLKDIFTRSREEVLKGARLGRVRIDVYQLRKDREHLLHKLGEAAYDLLVEGAVAHADLQAVFGEVRAIDEKIEAHELEIAELARAEEDGGASAEASASEDSPAVSPAAEDSASEKPAAKKAAAKKPAAKKPAAKKAAAKKPAAKKTAAKKTAAKKSAAKKTAAKKSAGKKRSTKKKPGSS